jgi:uncharacterized protein (DUF1015 family)
MGQHAQIGLVAVTSCDEYARGVIKKHELTRVDKENDRVRHMESLNAQTGPAFLVYPADAQLRDCLAAEATFPPAIDFVATDGIRHTSWPVRSDASQRLITDRFRSMPALYIADGHHRTAAALRVWQARGGKGASANFLSVLFPHDQVQILPYHRILKDLSGVSPAHVLTRLETSCTIQKTGLSRPDRPREMAFYVDHAWYTLQFRPGLAPAKDPMENLDVTLLQKHILGPVFGIEDPRTSSRIDFVGGIRGTTELERLVNSGEYACAFSMFPTRVEDLMHVADAGGIMPPKSTWFEPKLRDGMFCHLLG